MVIIPREVEIEHRYGRDMLQKLNKRAEAEYRKGKNDK